MDKLYTVIRFTQIGRGIAKGMTRHVWVSGVKFADGPGYKVKSVQFTPDREKASRFSLVAASDIAAQYYTSPATLERPDGTQMPEETAKLQAECWKRNAQAIKNRQDIAREWAAIWADAPEELKATLRKLGIHVSASNYVPGEGK